MKITREWLIKWFKDTDGAYVDEWHSDSVCLDGHWDLDALAAAINAEIESGEQ